MTTFTKLGLTALLVAAAALFFAKSGRPALEPFDDASYADIAKNIVKTGDWLHLRWLGGATFLEKPPLHLWMIAASFKIFGQNEFAARLFSSLCGLGTILVTVLFGRELFRSGRHTLRFAGPGTSRADCPSFRPPFANQHH